MARTSEQACAACGTAEQSEPGGGDDDDEKKRGGVFDASVCREDPIAPEGSHVHTQFISLLDCLCFCF
jgi:hypothetical protein